jgi:hypothetical protein
MKTAPMAFGLAWLAIGCSSEELSLLTTDTAEEAESAATDADAEDGVAATPIRLDVLPMAGVRADVDFLPQTFSAPLDGVFRDFALGEPVALRGSVSAFRVTPTFSDVSLPGGAFPTAGVAVSLRAPQALQSANGVVDDAGLFELQVPPDPNYRFSVVPSVPDVPFQTLEYPLSGDTIFDVDLGSGVALWGRITDDQGQPMPNVFVHAVDAFGVHGAAARTNGRGDYNLRVLPGTYDLICAGRDAGRDPVLTLTGHSVGEEGSRADFAYVDLRLTSVTGRAVDADGRGIASANVRFDSLSLTQYPTDAYFSETVATNANGNFDTRLPSGRYRMTVESSDNLQITPLMREVSVGESLADLGSSALDAFVGLQAVLVDPNGVPVPGALVSVTQEGFSTRRFEAAADATGVARLLVPDAGLRIALTPPADRPELPLTRLSHDAGDALDPEWSFSAGTPLRGRVVFPGANGVNVPMAAAVVRAVDAAGDPIGLALTDTAGEFQLVIADPSGD